MLMSAMNALLRNTLFVLAVLIFPSSAFAQTPTWLFIHTPNSGSGATPASVTRDLDNLLDSLEMTLDPGGNNPPKICLFGYSGQWFPTPSSGSPNLAGAAANAIGNASATDNRSSYLLEISYCTAKEVLKEIISSEGCDVVIGLGEGLGGNFVLESHGSTRPCIEDCNGGNNGGNPACTGGTCTGTDWDEPAPGGGTIGGGTLGGYGGTTTATTSNGGNAGRFLCGWFCCAKCCVMDAVSQCTDAGVGDGGADGGDADTGDAEVGDASEDAGVDAGPEPEDATVYERPVEREGERGGGEEREPRRQP